MEVDYTRTLTKIDKMFRFKEISENEWRVLYAIFEKFNDFQFQSKSSKFANPEIMSRSSIFNTTTINRIFNNLAQKGFIEFEKGTRGGDAKTITPLFFVYKSVNKDMNTTRTSKRTSERVSDVYHSHKETNTLTSKAIAKLSKDNNKDVEKVDDVVFVETSTSQKLSSYWQQIIMTTINGNQIQDLAQDAQDFGEQGVELVQRAIDITANAGAKSFKYYSAIVNDWSQKGVKTLGDVDMLAQQRQKSKQFSQGSKAFGRQRPIIEPQLASIRPSQTAPEISDVDFEAVKNKLANIKTHT